jgi:tRNA (guanine26-N2/guanine27-N2)-dimethyltransferase
MSDQGFPTETIEEGNVKVLVPKLGAFVKSASEYAPSKAPVFYNPVMELNRDVAVLALQAYQKTVNRKIRVCEPLTGCGLRGIRFATEVKDVKKTIMSDINEKAFKLAAHNIKMNKLTNRAIVKHKEANTLLGSYSAPNKRFDAIDIDPFGTPVRHIDSSIRALRDGGLLALTATDMAPLCGVHPRACVRKYGGRPLRTEYCHELAVRLLAGCLAIIAAKHDIGINVVFSHSANHYIRLYAIVRYGAREADESLRNMGFMLHCFKCMHRETTKQFVLWEHASECSECGSKLSFAGPLWVGKIADLNFCRLIEEELRHRSFKLGRKIEDILALVEDEVDAPIGFYVVDKLCGALSLPVPPVKKVREALKSVGFEAVLTHFHSRGVKTDASAGEMKRTLQQLVTTIR